MSDLYIARDDEHGTLVFGVDPFDTSLLARVRKDDSLLGTLAITPQEFEAALQGKNDGASTEALIIGFRSSKTSAYSKALPRGDSKYWKRSGSQVVVMSVEEKAAVGAAEEAQRIAQVEARLVALQKERDARAAISAELKGAGKDASSIDAEIASIDEAKNALKAML